MPVRSMSPMISLSILLLAFTGCGNAPDTEADTNALLETDRAFAQYSRDHDAAEAFQRYLMPEAIQLPDGGVPIRGRDTIFTRMKKSSASYTMTWEPEEAAVAASGELGYTWGFYRVTFQSASGDTNQSEGKYLNVWRKNAEGNWRVLIDMGNENPPGK